MCGFLKFRVNRVNGNVFINLLYKSKQISSFICIKAYNGSISMESTPGRGTDISIQLDLKRNT